jgi:hypothetical protein
LYPKSKDTTKIKKIMRKILASCVLLPLASLSSFGQSIQIDDVAGREFTGVNTILSPKDNSVAGYYTIYEIEKATKGMRTYQFAFIDSAVTKTVTTNIDIHKAADLNKTVFNGKYMLVSYEDWTNKKLFYKVIGLDGKLLKSKEEVLDRKTFVSFSVFPAENGEGYYIIKATEPKKEGTGYKIEKVDNSLNVQWTVSESSVKGVRVVNDIVNNHGKLVVWSEYYLKGKFKPSIVCLDGKTGSKIYERDGYDGQSTIIQNQIRIAKDGSVVLGGAYVNAEGYDDINNDGIYLLKLDASGKEVLFSKIPNKEKIQPALKTASSGFAVGSKEKIFIKDLIINGDEIVVVSEMFRKNINVTPPTIQATRDLITGKYIGYPGGTDDNPSKVTFEILDYIIFKFDSKGDLKEIKSLVKDGSEKITVWAPYNIYGGMTLARILDYYGWFDYAFSGVGADGKPVMVCKSNTKETRPEVQTYTLDKSYANKKVDLKQEAKIDLEQGKVGYFRIMPSIKSKMALCYYQKKLKRITINLESL